MEERLLEYTRREIRQFLKIPYGIEQMMDDLHFWQRNEKEEEELTR